MASALFTSHLVEAYLSARHGVVLDNGDLEKLQQKIQDNIGQIVTLQNEESESLAWDSAFNKQVLRDLYELKEILLKNLAEIETKRSYALYQNVINKKSILSAVRMMEDQCIKGIAVSPLNAGQKMPALLKNSYSIQINYSYNTDNGHHSLGGQAPPDMLWGQPEVHAVLTTGATYAANLGGPVGWAIATGLATVQYFYNSDEKRKSDVERSEAYIRTLDQQARSEDVRRYYQMTCEKYLPTFKSISHALQSEDPQTIAEVRAPLVLRQKGNIERYQKTAESNDPKALGEFLTKTLKLNDLVDLTLIFSLEGASSSSQQILSVHMDPTSMSYYQDVVQVLDQRIRYLQSISYQLSLLEQDQNILHRLRENSLVLKEIHDLISAWNPIFTKALGQRFHLTNAEMNDHFIDVWVERYQKFKGKFPQVRSEELDRRYKLLLKMTEVRNAN